MAQKKLIKNFIKTHELTVISTVAKDATPESAVIKFAATPDLSLIFNTFTNSRKYKNIRNNHSVSFVIGWDERITVQYVGLAKELEGAELTKYRNFFYAQNPKSLTWEGRKDIAFFKVTPTWIRYSDLNKDPWEIFEIKTF